MRDPREGVSRAGTIVTGADRSRVPARFRRMLDDAVARFADLGEPIDVYVYGSVATGAAVPGVSDVDLLTIGANPADADEIAETMSARYAADCRAVEVAVAQRADYFGETDEAYGNRVFLRHYCVHLAGPHAVDVPDDFPADQRAARGFNGDIGRHLRRWHNDLDEGAEPTSLGRTLARKTLLAVAGLVSVRDHTWTTHRDSAASRWAQLHPELAVDLATLQSWSGGTEPATHHHIDSMLDSTISAIVTSFRTDIGLWR